MNLPQTDWLRTFRIYFAVIAIGNLVWETLQLPLYTIWTAGTVGEQAFAVAHCTGGDLLIALASLTVSLLLLGTPDWPQRNFQAVAVLAILIGIAYTGFSEWLNVAVRRTWAYSNWMPVISVGPLQIGASPLAQWIVIPMLGFWFVRRF